MPPQTPQPTPGTNTPQVDQTALQLSRAIRAAEGGDYHNTTGDAGTSKGAYQWQPGHFESAAKSFGLDGNDFSPTNQDHVAYEQIKQQLDKGYTQSQVASWWNSGKYDPTGNVGTKTINGQAVHFDTPGYVAKVQKYYQDQNGSNSQSGGIAPPTPPGQTQQQSSGGVTNLPPPTPPTSISGGSPSATNLEPSVLDKAGSGNYVGAATDAAKGIGNFLFPIVGDLYHDVKGDSKKTFLQQAGDTALSALPFIPGLGEVGEAARGAKVAGEGAGLLTKALTSTAAKGAGVGYGAGVASNLAQGQGVGQSLLPNANNLIGAATGGVAPLLIKGAAGIANKVAGIDPQVATELARMGSQPNPEDSVLYKKYMDATKAHASDLKAKAPLTMAADELDTAAAHVQQQVKDAGAAVGEAKKAGANLSLGPITDVGNNFAKQVSEKFGLALSSDENGRVVASPLNNSMRQVSRGDVQRIEDMATQLNKLHNEGGNVKNATEVMDNFNDLVDHSKDDLYGHTNDPLESLIKTTAGNLSEQMKKVSPQIAETYAKFSGLKDLEREIKTMAGGTLNRGELLMRRVFSGDKSGDVQDFFAKLKAATGIDLTKHAVLAKHAIQTVGSRADKTLFEQIIGSAAEGKGGLINGVANFGKNMAQKTFANPEKIGAGLVSGKKGSVVPGLVTKGLIRASQIR